VLPTLTALETHAGARTEPSRPSLPDATTVAMPAARSLSIAAIWAGKEASQSDGNSPPSSGATRLAMLMLTEAIARVERNA
jgi:hypothetical protein